MERADRPFKMFMFFCSGANYFYNDYPVVSSPALNAAFLGAGTIYDGGNGFNQEPLQWIDAEYSWNVQSTGFYRDPKSYETAMTIRLDLQHNRVWPEEIFGQGGLLERACIRLYGEKAAPSMVRFNTLFEEASADETPPRMWPRLYPLTAMWRNLAVDRRTWGRQIEHVRLVQFMKEQPTFGRRSSFAPRISLEEVGTSHAAGRKAPGKRSQSDWPLRGFEGRLGAPVVDCTARSEVLQTLFPTCTHISL